MSPRNAGMFLLPAVLSAFRIISEIGDCKMINVPVRKMDPWSIYFGFWCLMINTIKLD